MKRKFKRSYSKDFKRRFYSGIFYSLMTVWAIVAKIYIIAAITALGAIVLITMAVTMNNLEKYK